MNTPWSATYGASPDGLVPLVQPPQGYAGRPNGARSQSSHQVYPASQPVTPAGKYELGPPPTRDQRSVSLGQAQTQAKGFRDVMDWQDLRPVINERPAGRRPDPVRPGKYISVS